MRGVLLWGVCVTRWVMQVFLCWVGLLTTAPDSCTLRFNGANAFAARYTRRRPH